jgi:hypothetical protein
VLKYGNGNAELKGPRKWLLYLRINFWRQRRFDPDAPADFLWNAPILLKTILRALRIDDIAAKKGSAAVKLKIEIPGILPWLGKEFDTTILPDLALISGPSTSYKPIFHLKNPVDGIAIVQQTKISSRPMLTALRPKPRDLCHIGPVPHGIASIGSEWNLDRRFPHYIVFDSNGLFHLHVSRFTHHASRVILTPSPHSKRPQSQ